MTSPTMRDRAAAARQVVMAMVQPTVQISVQVGGMVMDDHRSSVRMSRTVRPATALVRVEMAGPGERHPGRRKTVIDQAEAHAWCNDEILGAARRAAEGIIRRNPAWRCDDARNRPDRLA
ncbi:MAG: hypothetical protein JO128_16890 [Alphaproteobacteria bacterium]|nr:hypothetical protein [Alphaproteobacteria bacterium]